MEDIHKKFVKFGANARMWMRKCELLLPEIAEKEIWKKKRFGSIYEYAAKLAGMNRDKVNECLRIHGHIEDKPELMEVAEKKGLGSVRPVATIATQEDAGFWAEKAETMGKNALEVYTREFRPSTAPQPVRLQILVNLKPELAKRFEKLQNRDDFEDLVEKFLDQIEEKPEPVETESRHIPNKIQKYICDRSGNVCEYPGCNRRADLFHHIDRFATHHCHDPDKIRHFCKGHHDLAHRGLIENEDKPPEFWEIREKPEPTEVDRLVQEFKASSSAS